MAYKNEVIRAIFLLKSLSTNLYKNIIENELRAIKKICIKYGLPLNITYGGIRT